MFWLAGVGRWGCTPGIQTPRLAEVGLYPGNNPFVCPTTGDELGYSPGTKCTVGVGEYFDCRITASAGRFYIYTLDFNLLGE